MYMYTNDTKYSCSYEPVRPDLVRIAVNEEPTVGTTIDICRDDDGFVMAHYIVSDFAYPRYENGIYLLTNSAPAPEPSIETKLAELKVSKRAEMNNAASVVIMSGVDVLLSGGAKKHFSLTMEDQMNIKQGYDACKAGAEGVLYHADGESCKVYVAADMIAIGNAAIDHVTYHTTYCNKLYEWIASCTDYEVLTNIQYGSLLPTALRAEMEELLAYASAHRA